MTQRPTTSFKKSADGRFSQKNPHVQSTVANKSFPYDDEYEDFEFSDKEIDLISKIRTKLGSSDFRSDSLMTRDSMSSTNISKVTEVAKGISPFPSMYKKRDGHIGKSAENINNIHSGGFYMGSNISGHTYNIENKDDESEEPVYSLEDLAIKQLKEYIHIILMEIL